jgi:hypothetical protein
MPRDFIIEAKSMAWNRQERTSLSAGALSIVNPCGFLTINSLNISLTE